MKRNLRFWTRHTWESTGVELAVVAVLVVLTAVSADELHLELLASVVPYFLLVSGCLCMMMINYGNQILYIPLLISMGEPRKNILAGFHYYRCLIITVTVTISAMIWALVPCPVSAIGLKSIPTILTLLVLASAVGSLMGTTYAKCKWLSIVFVAVVCGGMGGGLSGFMFSGGLSLVEASTMDFAGALLHLPWWLVLAAVVAFLLDLGFQWLLLRRQEVKF